MRFLTVLLLLTLTPILVAAPERWLEDIERFEQADAINPPPLGGVVFVGSSSIVMWRTLHEDFREWPVIKRGFGGSELADSVFYADRIILRYQPETVVVYAGENDLAAGKTPETVHESFLALVAKLHAADPETRVLYVAMKPSPARWALREAFERGNQLIAQTCTEDPRLTFVDVWTPMLGPDGQPRPELFTDDMLHMNATGYALWRELLVPLLDRSDR